MDSLTLYDRRLIDGNFFDSKLDLDAELGLELEVETEGLPDWEECPNIGDISDAFPFHKSICITEDAPKFKLSNDPSLRNFGVELISEPFNHSLIDNVSRAVGLLDASVPFLQGQGGTSTHVHLNMLRETGVTIGNFATLWTLFEETFVGLCGESRGSNLFSLPISRAREGLYAMIAAARWIVIGEGSEFIGNPQQFKYAALNFCPLQTLGTIEVRTMEGTTDPTRVWNWLTLLYQILTAARVFKDPLQILEECQRNQPGFISDVMGPSLDYVMESECLPNEAIEVGLWDAWQMALALDNWHAPISERDVKQARYWLDQLPASHTHPEWVSSGLRRRLDEGRKRAPARKARTKSGEVDKKAESEHPPTPTPVAPSPSPFKVWVNSEGEAVINEEWVQLMGDLSE